MASKKTKTPVPSDSAKQIGAEAKTTEIQPVTTEPVVTLTPAEMTKTVNLLLDHAADASARMRAVLGTKEALEFLGLSTDLSGKALELNARIISILADEAQISGRGIVAKLDASKKTLEKITKINAALARIQKVLAFATSLLSGSGTAIVEAFGALSAKD